MASGKFRIRVLSIAAVLGLLAGMFAVLAPVADATPGAPCRVTNLATLTVYTGTGENLQTAIDESQSGAKLRVRGVCVGNFVIGNAIELIGFSTEAYPVPTLDASHTGIVLTVNAGRVVLKDLTITKGQAQEGGAGGILNQGGTLILKGSTSVKGNSGTGIINAGVAVLVMKNSSSVTGNTTTPSGDGGGIINQGRLFMNDSSSVSLNTAGNFGGGISNQGRPGVLTMNDSSSVTDNTASHDVGGGIYNFGGRVTMNDSSLISGNTSSGDGGGIFNSWPYNTSASSTVTMNGSSKVSGNTSSGDGGGIWNDVHAVLNGAVDGGNVVLNSPDNIFQAA